MKHITVTVEEASYLMAIEALETLAEDPREPVRYVEMFYEAADNLRKARTRA